MKVMEEKWVEDNGSIYTVNTVPARSDFPNQKRTIRVRVSIAFNVGKELAEHIVRVHNESLK